MIKDQAQLFSFLNLFQTRGASKRAPSMLERARGDSRSHVTDVDPG
jgi:hypothetical protein